MFLSVIVTWPEAGADSGFLEMGFICIKVCVCVGGGSLCYILSIFFS